MNCTICGNYIYKADEGHSCGCGYTPTPEQAAADRVRLMRKVERIRNRSVAAMEWGGVDR